MATRPSFIDVRSQSHGPLGSSSPSLRPLTSPRIHLAGEVPPELSPLDAFAAQSRLLAKQLQKSVKGGRRISRLPPLTIEHSFHGARRGYLQSVSAEDLPESIAKDVQTPVRGLKAESDDPLNRPISVYPRLSRVTPLKHDVDASQSQRQDEEQFRGRTPHGPVPDFGIRREASPELMGREIGYKRTETSPSYFAARPSMDSTRQRDQPGQQVPETSVASRSYGTYALAPPRSAFTQRTSSIRSDSGDGSEEDYSTSLGASFLSESRKLSMGNSFNNRPASPFLQSIPRSPSVNSDMSTGGSRLSRPTFNFSRPLSRAGEPPPEVPTRQTSSDSQPFILADDTIHTPVSMHSEVFLENGNVSPGAPSYVYSTFSMPRGKILRRNSRIFLENQPTAEFRWEQPAVLYSNAQPYASQSVTTPPSPPSCPSSSSLDQPTSRGAPGSSDSFPWATDDMTSPRFGQNKSKDYGLPASITDATRPHTASIASRGTIKGSSLHTLAPLIDITAEEHVAKGIDCHEQGSLKESTYHLRIAARQNHPTGMLLYALACRHGWGMRPNQREGVEWLRKAADSAFLEVADDESLVKAGGSVDGLEQKTRKAQFALSIYELGVSHMNGWGIEQDKVLALRCFEIAGAWGDGDALAEAGFCYAQGIGCKKDLTKSAKFYRMAESKGISMVGNSWIYKSKYKDKSVPIKSTEALQKKSRNKSRTRTMFGRMKSSS